MISICETWLNYTVTNSMIDPESVFNIYRCDRIGKEGGGVVVLVNRKLKTVALEITKDFSYIECIGFDIICNLKSKIRVLTIYRPPGRRRELGYVADL